MRILVLPGTVWQIPLIKKIKFMGHNVYVTNPIKIEEVYELADKFLEADIFDYNTLVSFCEKEYIDVVMSEECDIATDVVEKLNKKIGANNISAELANLFTNKYSMREFCKKNNFNSIPYCLCRNQEEAIDFFEVNGPKVIMKPLDSNASHGVFTVNSIDDIKSNFDETIAFSRNLKAVLIEKYIDGTEFTVDGLMTNKGHVTLAISEKTHYEHNSNIANSLFFTQSNPNFDYELLRKINDSLINATGLPFGLTHVEYKFQDGQYYLIEMAARGGGNLISAIIAPFMSGVDNYKYLINNTIDINYISDISVDIHNERTAILKFLDLPYDSGIVKEIYGEDYLNSDTRIKSYKLNFAIGDYICKPESDSVRIGYYIICANNRDEFNEVTRNIETKFKIVVESK